jgi:hypothetical protein
MMQKVLPFPVDLGFEEIIADPHISRGAERERLSAMLDGLKELLNPKAIYSVAYIDEKLPGAVLIGGIRFRSRVLRKNLENTGRVFPFVVTIGPGLDQHMEECSDLLDKYYLDRIGNLALRKARSKLKEHLSSKFALQGLSHMSPGSLKDWPIEEQRPLFELLGRVEEGIGVRLTESLLMLPAKSVSGIFFPSEGSFYSCQLCPRGRCEGRKAPFNKELAKEYGLL